MDRRQSGRVGKLLLRQREIEHPFIFCADVYEAEDQLAELVSHALALQEARAMIANDVLGGRIQPNQFIEVRGEHGKLVHQLSFRDAVTISGRADNSDD